MEDVILQVNHLSKSFGSHEVLRDIDFTVAHGGATATTAADGFIFFARCSIWRDFRSATFVTEHVLII